MLIPEYESAQTQCAVFIQSFNFSSKAGRRRGVRKKAIFHGCYGEFHEKMLKRKKGVDMWGAFPYLFAPLRRELKQRPIRRSGIFANSL